MREGGTSTSRPSQVQRILAILNDHRWHTAAELYRTGCVLHSRVSDLRKKGYVVEIRHVGGVGAEAYEYRLAGTPDEAALGGEPLTSLPAVSSGAPADTPPCVGSGGLGAPDDVHAGQLTIEAA